MDIKTRILKMKTEIIKTFGKNWIYTLEFRNEYDVVKNILKKYKLNYCGSGAYRLALSHDNIIIKIELDGCEDNDNSYELSIYNKLTRKLPEFKYFMSPYIGKFTIGKRIFTVYHKVEEVDRNPSTYFQRKMQDVNSNVLNDLCGHNYGRFCDGWVAIDFNSGSAINDYGDDYKIYENMIKGFIKKHSDKWKTYKVNFNKKVALANKLHKLKK